MATPLLTTKLFVPPVRPDLVSRPRLIERLNTGLRRTLTLISAPGGFGKTTLLSEWAAGCERASLTKWPSWSRWASSKADPLLLLPSQPQFWCDLLHRIEHDLDVLVQIDA